MSTSPTFAPENMPAMVETLLARRPCPTAIFTINNQFGIVAMQAIRQAGLNIPDDVALVVFDDLAVFALTSPAISAVAQPAYEVGQRTVQLLLSRLKDDGEAPPQLIVLPTELIVRESA